nr:class I SAM-dependent methyltransferase [Anaerolineae bacterium]
MDQTFRWDSLWAVYDDSTYQEALSLIQPGSVILDIGAGDLRFARMMVKKGCRVIAVECQANIVKRCRETLDGIQVVVADAREWPFPTQLDAAVLLMRHCQDFGLYVQKLRACGCPILITNARWRMGVEAVSLSQAATYNPDRAGWSACMRCGAVQFILTEDAYDQPDIDVAVTNVEGCPQCLPL